MFAQEPWFMGLPNMRSLLRPRDDLEIDVPLALSRRENHPTWPAVAQPNNMMLLAGDSYGLVAEED
jgi:hypothetical protein